jgi:hypothetical protein
MAARAPVSALCAAAVALGASGSVRAYEFELRSRTVLAGYAVDARGPAGAIGVDRRRFLHTLGLYLWNLGRPRQSGLYGAAPAAGPRLYFNVQLRIAHDFGDWLHGSLRHGRQRSDALDLVPELESDSLQLDLLQAYFAAKRLWNERLDLFAGRLLLGDGLGFWTLDGGAGRLHLAPGTTIELQAGVRVRERWPLGFAGQEPDGSSRAECSEYVEAAEPLAGSWQPIDRDRPGVRDNPFRNELDRCPLAAQVMPTLGLGLAMQPVSALQLRLSYRRSVSATPGLIGAELRQDVPDRGYFPDELDQAPGWGVNEEVLVASARGHVPLQRGAGHFTAHTALRYSLVHGLVDHASAGLELRRGAHMVAPALIYTFPTFDGDSIFNVFSQQGALSAELAYDFWPARGPLSAHAAVAVTRLSVEDGGDVVADSALTGSARGGVRLASGLDRELRVDLLCDGGSAGVRRGGAVYGRWPVHPAVELAARLSAIDFRDGVRDELAGTALAAELGVHYLVADGVTARALAEESHGPRGAALRLLALFELALAPEH